MRRTTIAWSVCAAALLPAFTAGSAIASDPSTLQDAGQVAKNDQSAGSRATSTQDRPTNTNIQVSILSPGAGGGSVAQTNASEAVSSAGNENATAQRAGQRGGKGGRQDAGQAASNDQDADSEATSEQDHPSNTTIQVSILSPGAGGGSVRQGNGSKATSAAGSRNATDQAAEQAGGGHPSGGTQAIGQKAHNEQEADSEATSEQDHPSNLNIVVAILSPGAGGGSVGQANVSSAESEAGNANATTQASRQHRDGGGRGAVQSAGQLADSGQDADSEATSEQDGARNAAAALGAKGGHARDGGARQVNASTAKSASGSTNATTQDAGQSAARSGGFAAHAVQAQGQKAVNEQDADSDATSEQDEPLNLHLGSGGALFQDNVSRAGSTAANENETVQRAAQALGAVAALEELAGGRG